TGRTEVRSIADVVCFQAAHPGLDVATLAYGAAASLAHDTGGIVYVVDLQGKESFVRAVDVPEPSGEPELAVPVDQRTGSVATLKVVWPDRKPGGVPLTSMELDQLVEGVRARDGVRWVVVVHDPHADEDPSIARDLAERLNLRSSAVFYVADD